MNDPVALTRRELVRRGQRLEYFTIDYNWLEGVISIAGLVNYRCFRRQTHGSESVANPPHLTYGEGAGDMHFRIDLDPTHSVIRLTVLEEIVSLECAESCYRELSKVTSKGGPYAAIYDLTRTKDTTIPIGIIQDFARRKPSVPTGRPRVVVGKFAAIYGLARLFQMRAESVGNEFEVVHTLAEAYELVRVSAEEFTERVCTKTMSA